MGYKVEVNPEQIIRMPLVGTYNTRTIDSGSALGGSGGVVGTGIVGNMVVGAITSNSKDQRFINCFPEKIVNPLTGAETFYITKRPGFATNSTPAAGSIGTALKVWSIQGSGGSILSAFGSTNSTIYLDAVSLGAITGKARHIEETLVGSTANAVITSEDSTAWYYPDGGALTQITDADYPGNATRTVVGRPVFMDGYMFVMDSTGRIYNSDLNSITAWTALSFLTAQMYPDQGIGLARYKNLIVALGKETIEFYENVGNPTGSPLQRVEQGFAKIGCVGQQAYTQIDDSIAWVSSSTESGIGVYYLEGMKPVRVSTPAIESQLSLADGASITLSAVKFVGKTFLVVVASGLTFVYVMEDKMWHEWTSGASTPLWHYMSGTSSGARTIYAISKTSTAGKVWLINPNSLSYQDNGSNFTMTIQTSKFDANNSYWKFLPRVHLIGDQNSSTNNISFSWSDDDYQTWSTARTIDMSDDTPYTVNMGRFKRRAFRLVNTSSLPLRLQAIELHLKQGS